MKELKNPYFCSIFQYTKVRSFRTPCVYSFLFNIVDKITYFSFVFNTIPQKTFLVRSKVLIDIIPPVPKSTSIKKSIFRRSFRLNVARRLRRRAIFKNGDCNILQSRISKRRLRYLQDIFTTLVDSQWRWTLTIFAVAFLGSWLIFALIWWLIAYSHDDFSEDHLPTHQADSNWAPCVLNIHGFTSCFLFSIETQHTIGKSYKQSCSCHNLGCTS